VAAGQARVEEVFFSISFSSSSFYIPLVDVGGGALLLLLLIFVVVVAALLLLVFMWLIQHFYSRAAALRPSTHM
jgi:hypothetical protein